MKERIYYLRNKKMTKVQKLWLGVFLAMFLVPEILWSPVVKSYISITGGTVSGHYKMFRPNFLDGYEKVDLWGNIILLQLFGIISLMIYLTILKKNIKQQIYFWISEILLACLAIFVFIYYSSLTIKITF